ncbi:MAG: hypothetical protein QGG19_16210 [Alphaproteobacteria bacterium]|nr:hypothetical protein [Alphaproteobacteria bacterium]MDP6254378.1 hypothetical protein [Alphaproteobacteria bacterium]MDP7459030.1 hypothetical protein [Alphaproteobacteria bacterium]
MTASEFQLCQALRRLPRQQRKTIHDLIMAFTNGPDAGDVPRPG